MWYRKTILRYFEVGNVNSTCVAIKRFPVFHDCRQWVLSGTLVENAKGMTVTK